MEKERLHKIMAARGVASRRACEELIAGGHVTVDGVIVTKPGASALPDADIRVDGRAVREPHKVYYILNKPRGYITSMSDDRGRMDIGTLVKRLKTRIYPVGRLDSETEGLLLLTNDGELTNRLTHPRFKVPKTYMVNVKGRMETEALERLRSGIHLREGKVSARVRVVRATRVSTRLEMVITQGYNRQIRRMCAVVGHQVKRLERVKFGPLRVRGLGRGAFRALTGAEVASLKSLTADGASESAAGRKSPPAKKTGMRKKASSASKSPTAKKTGRPRRRK